MPYRKRSRFRFRGRRRGYRRFSRRFRKTTRRIYRRRGHLRITQSRIKNAYLSDRVKIKFRYYTQFSTTPTQSYASWSYRAYSGNSLYDPDVTLTGNQPTGYDQWTAFYASYRVMGSKLTMKYANASNDWTTVFVNAALTSSLSTSTSTFKPEEQPYTITRQVAPYGTTGANPVTRISMYMTTQKIFQEHIMGDEDYAAPYNASPNNQWYWNIGHATYSSAAVPSRGFVTLTYYAVLHNRILQNIS